MDRGSLFVLPFPAARAGTGHHGSLPMLPALTRVHLSSYPRVGLGLAPDLTALPITQLEPQTNHSAGKESPAHLCFPGPLCLLKNVPVDFIVLVLQLVQLHLPQLPAHRTEQSRAERAPSGSGTGMAPEDGSQELWMAGTWEISNLHGLCESLSQQ